MATEPDDLVPRMLRDIRSDIKSIRDTLETHSRRFDHLERRFDDLAKIVRYSLGQSAEPEFRQTQQEARIDDLFARLEKLLSGKEPV